MYEIGLEPEVEDRLLGLPFSHYPRVMRNVDDYLVTGGVPDGDHIRNCKTLMTCTNCGSRSTAPHGA